MSITSTSRTNDAKIKKFRVLIAMAANKPFRPVAPNWEQALASPQSGASTANIAAPAISQQYSGVVEISAQITFGLSAPTGSTSVQLQRDGTPIGPVLGFTGTVTPQSAAITWIDTLPDNNPHVYSVVVTTTSAHVNVNANAGSIVVLEAL